MDYEFDRGIAVEAIGRGTSGEGEYAAQLDGGWIVGGGVNGGYLLAVIGNAVRHHLVGSGQPDPVSLSAYYLTPSVEGPARVRVRTLRAGGRRATVAASLLQQVDGADVERISVLATYADSAGVPDDQRRRLERPQIPAFEDCIDPVTSAPSPDQVPPLMRRLGTRFDPAYAGWAIGRPSGNGVIQGWFRLADDRPVDAVALLLAVDSLPPATFDLGLPGWAPTIELTAHVRGVPVPGPLVVRHETRTVAGGYFEEDCGVWDAAGRLVAQSRQLALLPRART